jgi:hypothetical protein
VAIRLDVLPDEVIEILRTRGGRNPQRYYSSSLDSALSMIRFLLKQDLLKAKEERFTPKIIKEARIELKKLQERNPYRGK